MNKILGCIAILIFVTVSCSKDPVSPQDVDPGGDPTSPDSNTHVSTYLTKAVETHDFIGNNLLTVYSSYRVNTTTNTSSAFEWYNVSQIYADAAMIASGDTSYLQQMNGTFKWMSNLWDDTNPIGGYFAFANLDGSGASGTKYVDDNALTGIAYLSAYQVTAGADKGAYLAAAKACADWLINSELWDNNLGGGFWWNTDKTVKPTQSNGLALQLFLRLYKITQDTVYRNWAALVNNWLSKKLFNNSTGLYFWQVKKDGSIDTEYFTYDNAIMVEANLLYGKIMEDKSYIVKAQTLGNAMISTLWNTSHNVFIFNTGDIRVNPTYCGWATQAMIKLYEADSNVSWLTYAKGNIDAINTVLRDPVTHGYYQYASLDGAGRYLNMEGVDQAWMQRLQILLSKYR